MPAKKQPTTPIFMQRCVVQVMKKGKNMTMGRAFAICTLGAQRSGKFKPGTKTMTPKGRAFDKEYTAKERAEVGRAFELLLAATKKKEPVKGRPSKEELGEAVAKVERRKKPAAKKTSTKQSSVKKTSTKQKPVLRVVQGGKASGRKGPSMAGLDLSGENFRDAKLRGSDLRGTKLNKAMMVGADLRDANLSGASLFKTVLDGADLSGATMKNANLGDALLEGARLRGAKMEGADLNHALLWEADLRDADLSNTNLTGTILNEALLEGADFKGARRGPLDSPVQGWILVGGRLQAAAKASGKRAKPSLTVLKGGKKSSASRRKAA